MKKKALELLGSEVEDNDVIKFKDLSFEQAVRRHIKKPTGEIYLSDIEKIKGLVLTNGKPVANKRKGILIPWTLDVDCLNSMRYIGLVYGTDDADKEKLLFDLMKFKHLKFLYIDTILINYSFISEYNSLEGLYIENLNIENWEFIISLVELKKLSINKSNFTDLKPLGELLKNQFDKYEIEQQKIDQGDIKTYPLEVHMSLTHLNLTYCKIKDIQVLSYANNIRELNLSHNEITDISSISSLKCIYVLKLRWNQIDELPSFKNMGYIYMLNLRHNNISDIATLKKYRNITISRLYLKYNNISDYSPTKSITIDETDFIIS